MTLIRTTCTLGTLAMTLSLSACGDGTGPGVPARLSFRATTGGTARQPLAVVEVEIQDANGNLVTSANDEVTIALDVNPGSFVLHASGRGANDRIIELVDHVRPEVITPFLSDNEGTGEIQGMVYDSTTGAVLSVDLDNALSSIDPVTGALTNIGDLGVNLKGIAFETGSGRLIGATALTDSLMEVDPTTGGTTRLGRVTISGDSIDGFTGLAVDPTSGMMYAVVRLRDNPNRKTRDLVTLDVTALAAAYVAPLSENGVSGITFLPDGTLLAVTGDGADNPETLWSVNKADGVMTSIIAMGNGADGESVAVIPARLTGTLTIQAVNGVAVFSGLVINAAADGYTFIATASGLTSATSAAFNIVR
ncbi:MAG: hypothetical protein OEO20_16265 [Gemmatimonadota bacterium]|nr:hypothetical protein [Gemmatimonadota bacterium]MDH5551191.1 hypothetical protein [Gemmatimonadota bacterium]